MNRSASSASSPRSEALPAPAGEPARTGAGVSVAAQRVQPDAGRRGEPGAATLALACAVALAIALGVGRFAFTPLLPLMLANGTLDIGHGGWLASANYAGYFLGALSCAAFRVEASRMVRACLAATIVLTAAMGVLHGFWVWMLVRFVGGMVSAWALVFASQWGMRRLAALGASHWSGAIFTGPGAGIVTTGLIGSALAGQRAELGWLGFAVLSTVLAALVWRVFRADHASPANVASAARADVPAATPSAHNRRDARRLVVLYGAPGFGYIITATLLPVIARTALPPGSPWPDLFWPMFGAAVVVGAFVSSRLPAAWDSRVLLAISCAVQALGIALGIA